MPELAEVEHARKHLERTCLGRVVLDARCEDDDRVVEGSPRAVEETLRGATVAGTGHPIVYSKVAGRSTAWVPALQR